MENQISTQVWIIATIFGGIGAALVQIIFGFIQSLCGKKRARKHLRREIGFNIKQAQQIIDQLEKLKEDHIKLDRQDSYWHFFTLKSSAVVFKNMINAGIIYDYFDDEQLIKIDNFNSENVVFLNEEIAKIRSLQYDKKRSADQVDWFITHYKNFRTDLEIILKGV